MTHTDDIPLIQRITPPPGGPDDPAGPLRRFCREYPGVHITCNPVTWWWTASWTDARGRGRCQTSFLLDPLLAELGARFRKRRPR